MDVWGETMDYCFSRLEQRVLDAVGDTDLNSLFEGLSGIKGSTVVTGVGGSSVVSAYFAKVVSKKNGIICTDLFPRDLLYRDLSGYRNVVACSYSGKNIGVSASFRNNLKKYLFSANAQEGIVPLRYTARDEERSFVSIAGTLIPMALLFLYYTDNDREALEGVFAQKPSFEVLPGTGTVEVLYGYENEVTAKFLESTLTEGGLAAPVMHEKYNYCHGRCRLNAAYQNDLIWFPGVTELDRLYEKELPGFYGKITPIYTRYGDDAVNEFWTTYCAMQLCRKMAEAYGKELSKKIIPEISEHLYLFQGEL